MLSPPSMNVGERPARVNMKAMRDEVVVLPWLPATAMTFFPSISSATICARLIARIPRRRASTSSGLSSCAADVYTTSSASSTQAAS